MAAGDKNHWVYRVQSILKRRLGPMLDPCTTCYWLSGVGRGLECGSYADELATGDKNKKAIGSACGGEVIAYLLAIKVYLLGGGIDVRLPVDDEINVALRLVGDRV